MCKLISCFLILSLASLAQGQESTSANDGEHVLRAASVEVNGIDLNYKLAGEGPPLLLLHGFSLAGTWWDSLVGDLATRNLLIIPDLPGHGRSTRHEGPYLFSQVARDLFSLLEHLHVDAFNAIGYSAGGIVLLHMGIQDPGRIEAMILISSTPGTSDEPRDIISEWPDLEDNSPALKEYWRQNHPGGDEQIRTLIDDLRNLGDPNENFEFTRDQLFEIEARTLIVVGDGDPLAPLDLALDLRQSILDSNIWVIPAQEHAPIWPDFGGSPHFRKIFPSVAHEFLHGTD